MNRDMMKATRDSIAASKTFDMRQVLHGESHARRHRHDCGTASCIAGHVLHVAALLGDPLSKVLIDDTINGSEQYDIDDKMHHAGDLLGLNAKIAMSLFMGYELVWGRQYFLDDITQEMAIAKLDEMLAQ